MAAVRIVIVDLHCNGFILRDFDHIVNKRWPMTKHAFFLKEALDAGYEVLDYITGTRSGLWIGKKSLLLNKLEAYYVLKKNGFKNKVTCITDAHEINEDDLVLFYSHVDDSFDLHATPGQKYCNVNHFFYLQSAGGVELPDFLQAKYFDGYVCEADVLHDSPFFRKYLPTEDKKMLLLPYVAEGRFKMTKPFHARENKALALGSVGIKSDLYRDVYNTDQLHPMRKELLDRKGEDRGQIECMVEHIVYPNDIFTVQAGDSRFVKFAKRFCNHFYGNFHSPFRKNGKNAGYYNKDRVEQLNEYKMFIYPEEVTGVPALGFVEGMNCGCAYIGLDSPMYSKIGMESGVHYIGYDGTYDDMVEKIKYYQRHNRELAQIAQNGYKFVKKQLSSQEVFKQFIRQLEGSESR